MSPVVCSEMTRREKSPASNAPSANKSGQPCRVAGARNIVNDLLPGFSRRTAAMLSAGMPIVASLNSLERQTHHEGFRIVIGQLRKYIEGGATMSEALSHFPSIFDALYINLIRAGESSGNMAETMSRLAGMLEKSSKLRKKIKSAMTYPVVVLCMALVITVAMIIFIVPVFAGMFDSFNQRLPAPTLFLMNTSELLKKYFPLFIIAIVAGVIAFKRWKATPKGAYTMDMFLLNVPVFGELNRKVASARFSRTFGQLIQSGVPILGAIEISAGATGNMVSEQIMLDAKATVERGEPLSSAMLNQTIFDPMLTDMLQAGEKTGRIDEMMNFSADYFDDEVNMTLDSLTALLEPFMMLFLGIMIGGIVVCMFLPIFKMPAMIH